MKKLATTAALAAITTLFSMTPVQATDSIQDFQFYCSQCHGLEGKGDGPNVTKDFPVSPRNFTNSAEMSKLSDADLKNVILDGGPSVSKSPMMPPWGKTLTEEQVAGLIKHLRTLCQCTGK
jgi:cytochrome c oxidase cbb3-type subunit III